MSADTRLIPVMVRGGIGVHAPSKYRVYGEYETFDEAAEVVQRLRRDESIAWAYIPDEYAPDPPVGGRRKRR